MTTESTSSARPVTVGYTIGRFNPLQNGHRGLLDEIHRSNDHMVVLVGSSAESRTHKNPLSFEERKALIKELYPKAVVLALPDMPSNDDWVRLFEATIAMGIDSLRLEGNVSARLYSADATRADDYALRLSWVQNLGHDVVPIVPVRTTTDLSATLVRDHWFTGKYEGLTEMVPPATLALMRSLDIGWMKSHYVRPLPLGELGERNSVYVAFASPPAPLETSQQTFGEPAVVAPSLGYLTLATGELSFAGGAVQEGEHLERALERRVRHDLGVTTSEYDLKLVSSHAMLGRGDNQHVHLYLARVKFAQLYGIRRAALDARNARTDVAAFCVTHLAGRAADVLQGQRWAGTGKDCLKSLLFSGQLDK